MTYDVLGPGPLDYLPCRYGTSKLLFRGPRRNLDDPYVAFLGGTETYGKFLERPFPALVEGATGRVCVNFGFPNAGIDVYAHDPFVAKAASEADLTVLQVMGAQNMTNRFYSVHPRRNDRFIGASPLMQTIFREVDFSEFHFTKHMLSHLQKISPERFAAVQSELQQAWLARMRLMLGQITGKTLLLWFADHAPPPPDGARAGDLGRNPLFISRDMLEEVAEHATDMVKVVARPAPGADPTAGMVCDQMETMAASEMLGPAAHAEAAAAVTAKIAAML